MLENLKALSIYSKIKNTTIALNNTTDERIKNNTARFKLNPTSSNEKYKSYYFIFPIKLFITSSYDYENISGTIEVDLVLYSKINIVNKNFYIYNKKIIYISDTRAITKFLNIDFEVVNNEYVDLVIRYNGGNSSFNIKILSDNKFELENPRLSNEDISKIQEWY